MAALVVPGILAKPAGAIAVPGVLAKMYGLGLDAADGDFAFLFCAPARECLADAESRERVFAGASRECKAEKDSRTYFAPAEDREGEI